MQAEPFHITKQHVDNAPIEIPTTGRSGFVRRSIPDRRVDSPTRVRLGLQTRAQGNLQRHVLRALERFFVLLVADLASFYVMRAGLRTVRDNAALGDWFAGTLAALLPSGILNGWQFAAALFIALLVTGNYGPGDQRRSLRRLFMACALATALPLWMTLWTRGVELVAVHYALTTALVWIGLASQRIALDHFVARVRVSRRAAAPTLFVGPAEDCRDAMQGRAFARTLEYKSLGFVDVHVPPAPDALGHIVDFALLLSERRAETVVICGYLSDGRFHDVVDAALAAGCQVFSVPRAIDVAAVQPTLVWRRSQALIELTRPSLQGQQLFLKRVLDIVGSSAALLLLAPLMLVIGTIIKLESSGPVLFAQRRLGKNGRAFRCFKFRSMHINAEARLRSDLGLYRQYVQNSFKLPEHDDPRLTRVGRFLRSTSLDELPQFINVLKGEMSLVGPRPIVPEELELYGQGAPRFLSLKPGVTGAWQVNGRSAVGYPDRAVLELEYVRSWSLLKDLLILIKTIPAVLRRHGAH